MTKWQYLVETWTRGSTPAEATLSDTLNCYGASGWELVSMHAVASSGAVQLTFKRPAPAGSLALEHAERMSRNHR